MKYSNANFESDFRLKYTKVLWLKSIFILLISACGHAESPQLENVEEKIDTILEQPIQVGAQNIEAFIELLQNKRVGIVGNQSSRIGEAHLVDSLLSLNVTIQAVFTPEHGFRGDADAGEHVDNQKDAKTGLPIISLYGNNKKPTKDQLAEIDIMLFDIQDVGVRFYTYISTLHYVMEACAQSNIPLIIFDRPNPNGHYIDGPILEKKFQSFVGMHSVPIVHGMTVGEYAHMINGEKWLENNLHCDITVIKCKNYNHDRPYSLPVPPSPNLRSDVSIQLYPSLCLLEATTVSVGRGTDGPFERYGHPDFPETGYTFIPKESFGSKNPKLKSKKCNGYNLNDSVHQRMNKLDLSFLIQSYNHLAGQLFFEREKFFNLLAGNSKLIEQIKSGLNEDQIRNTWQTGLTEFKAIREKYLLYE